MKYDSTRGKPQKRTRRLRSKGKTKESAVTRAAKFGLEKLAYDVPTTDDE